MARSTTGKSFHDRMDNEYRASLILSDQTIPLYKPSWDFKALVFRPLPVVDENGDITPFVYDEDSETFGEWFARGFRICEISTPDKLTRFIIQHGYDDDSVLEESPANAMYRFLSPYKGYLFAKNQATSPYRNLIDKKLLKIYSDSNYRFMIRKAAFVQALILANQSIMLTTPEGLKKNEKIPIVMLTGSVIKDFIDCMESDIPGAPKVDIIDLESGSWIKITRAGAENKWLPVNGTDQGAKYSCKRYKIFDSLSADISSYWDIIKNKLHPWDKIFYLPDYEEQLQLIVNSHYHPALIYAALGDTFPLPNTIIKEGKRQLGLSDVVQGVSIEKKNEVKESTGSSKASVWNIEDDDNDNGNEDSGNEDEQEDIVEDNIEDNSNMNKNAFNKINLDITKLLGDD